MGQTGKFVTVSAFLPSEQTERTDMPLFLRTDTHIKRGEAKNREILELGGFVVEFLSLKNSCYLIGGLLS